MKRNSECFYCRNGIGYGGHLALLAIFHLTIEHFPRTSFLDYEVFDKAGMLWARVPKRMVHLNLGYALVQFNRQTQAVETQSA